MGLIPRRYISWYNFTLDDRICQMHKCTNCSSVVSFDRFVNVLIWLFPRHLYLFVPSRFYLKEFKGSKRWLIFLEGEYLKLS